MSYNGAGVYSLPAGQPVTTGTTISSTTFNTLTSDLATALSMCITKDGQQTVTANIPMATYRLTGLGAGTLDGHSLRYEQLFTTGAVTLLGALNVPGATTISSTDAGASAGPALNLYRNSATPAASDALGYLNFQGEDSAGNTDTYGYITTTILDPTSGSEDGRISFQTVVAGTLAGRLRIEAGLYTPNATGGDCGSDTINVSGVYVGGVAQSVSSVGTQASTFTFDGTGGDSASTTMTYQKVGNFVTLHIPAVTATSGTGSTTFTSNTALPAAIRPTTTQVFPVNSILNNGGGTVDAGFLGIATSGIITLKRDQTATAWTNASTCGTVNPLTVTYFLG